MSLDGIEAVSETEGEISTFCPVRLFLANHRCDGLLDTLDVRGGCFYVLTDWDLPAPGTPQRAALEAVSHAELAFGPSENELRIPCRVRGLRIDDDGLYLYAALEFRIGDALSRRRLESLIASLW